MVRARAAREERPTSIRASEAKVLQEYVSLVSRLPFVERVYAVPEYDGVEIWTVIDAEPFDTSPRRQVYGAELQAWDQSPKALVLFRLVNRREYGDEKLGQVAPEDRYLAWRRTARA